MSAPRPKHRQVVIWLSLQVLRAAMQRSVDGPVQTFDVRLALRCLLPHCPDRWPLLSFWDAAGATNDIGRAQGCTAGFNAIVRQLRLAGRYPDGAEERAAPANDA